MGKLGSYEYPDNTIEECARIVETIEENNITKQELLSTKLGHESPKSGTFRGKLTSLRRYGLITGRGEIQLSNLAKKIANPAPGTDERGNAMGEAVLNVSLLERLYSRLDAERPDNEFWYHLVEIADVERSEAKNKATEIGRLYENGLRYVQDYFDSQQQTDRRHQDGERTSTSGDVVEGSVTMSETADAKLVTKNAQIEIVDRSTFVAARALFEELAKKYEEETPTD